MTDLAEKTATEILTEIDALAERRAQLEELVRELGNALTPMCAFVQLPHAHQYANHDTYLDRVEAAGEKLPRVRELMAQIRELLR